MPNSNKPWRPPAVLAALACALMLGGCGQGLKIDEVYGGYYPPNSANSVAPKRVAQIKPKPPATARALLQTPSEPDCGVQKGSGRSATSAAKTEPATQSIPEDAGDPNAELAMRIKLEYERECYRQAEQRMRDRLRQLQTSTKAAKGSEPSQRAQ